MYFRCAMTAFPSSLGPTPYALLIANPGFSGIVREREVVFSEHGAITREGTAAHGAQTVVVGVLVQNYDGELVKCGDLATHVGVRDRLGHTAQVLKNAGQPCSKRLSRGVRHRELVARTPSMSAGITARKIIMHLRRSGIRAWQDPLVGGPDPTPVDGELPGAAGYAMLLRTSCARLRCKRKSCVHLHCKRFPG
jgi:hypothetical protein